MAGRIIITNSDVGVIRGNVLTGGIEISDSRVIELQDNVVVYFGPAEKCKTMGEAEAEAARVGSGRGCRIAYREGK
jgi:hypothetical protein